MNLFKLNRPSFLDMMRKKKMYQLSDVVSWGRGTDVPWLFRPQRSLSNRALSSGTYTRWTTTLLQTSTVLLLKLTVYPLFQVTLCTLRIHWRDETTVVYTNNRVAQDVFSVVKIAAVVVIEMRQSFSMLHVLIDKKTITCAIQKANTTCSSIGGATSTILIVGLGSGLRLSGCPVVVLCLNVMCTVKRRKRLKQMLFHRKALNRVTGHLWIITLELLTVQLAKKKRSLLTSTLSLAKGDNSLNVWYFLSYCNVGRWDIKVLTDVPKHLNCKFRQLWVCNKFAKIMIVEEEWMHERNILKNLTSQTVYRLPRFLRFGRLRLRCRSPFLLVNASRLV